MDRIVGDSLAQGHLYLGHPNQAQGVIDQEESNERDHSRQSNTGLGGRYVLKASPKVTASGAKSLTKKCHP